ncbi:zinc finger protein 614-like [Pelobates fuscus]|uniref:zinc finger protein 614-like n=1 Tax=Pelobates fuscus TaxID=191477 RepID=UPI002FE48DAA
MMNKKKQDTIERFLNHTLEIIYMLTGEEYVIVKKKSPQREVPIKCGDVSVYFSMEEWDYIEEHKDLYVDVMMDNHQSLGYPAIPSPQSPGIAGSCNADPELNSLNLSKEEVRSEKDVPEIQILSDIISDTKSGKEDENRSHLFQYRPMIRNTLEESHQSEYLSDAEVYTVPDLSSRMIEDHTSVAHNFQRQDCDEDVSREFPSLEASNLTSTSLSFQSEQNLNCVNQIILNGNHDALCCHRHVKVNCLDYDYSSKSTYETTQPSQIDENLHRNADCGKYTYKCSFVVHQRQHTDSKIHQCAVCGKYFAHKSSLVKHHKIHTGEKDHICSECGKPFALKYNLVQHLRSHTGEKPYKCATCGKYFAYKSAYNQHQKTHNKEKSHVCLDCGRCFSRKSNLVSHQSVHVQETTYIES